MGGVRFHLHPNARRPQRVTYSIPPHTRKSDTHTLTLSHLLPQSPTFVPPSITILPLLLLWHTHQPSLSILTLSLSIPTFSLHISHALSPFLPISHIIPITSHLSTSLSTLSVISIFPITPLYHPQSIYTIHIHHQSL